MFERLMVMLLALALVPALASAVDSKFVKGDNLGTLDIANKASFHANAKRVVQANVLRHFGAVGGEEVEVVQIRTDRGLTHVRLQQTFNGMDVVGAQMMVHADASGKIFAANGEFVPASQLPLAPALDAAQAFAGPISRLRVAYLQATEPELTYVLGSDREGHLAWMITVEYQNALGPQRDKVYADAMTGKVVARHPQNHYALSLETIDCSGSAACIPPSSAAVVSTSSNAINTGDLAIDSAHNFAIATYDYYWNNHGRDSIDDAGLPLISRVHYKSNYNGSFWRAAQKDMTYGDGDGVTFVPLSQDADVVAHEITHGVTQFSSGLISAGESGALNEAWSDIFGALVDYQEGATGADVWLFGEDIYTPGIPGDGLRNMADPAAEGDIDCYPNYLPGGGVHTNSTIASLAFVLLVDGGPHPDGTHPQCMTSVNTAIGLATAAAIFYDSNVACLTSSSNFKAARCCTAGSAVAYGAVTSVHEAWDAVGVSGGALGDPCMTGADCCSGNCSVGPPPTRVCLP